MSTITFKITFRDNTHRFSIPESELTIEKLNETMVEVFQKKNIPKFQKKYQDPDGDMITLQSKLDLEEAVKVAKESTNCIVRISLHRPSTAQLVCGDHKLSRRHGNEGNSSDSDDTQPLNPHKEGFRKWRKLRCMRRQLKANELKSTFIKDVTLTDSSEVCINEKLVKVWRLINTGDKPWPIGSCLTYISGDKLSATESVILDREVQPDETLDISFNFIAPSKPGRYISHFRMASPEGQLFGQRIYIDIIVDDKPIKDEYVTKEEIGSQSEEDSKESEEVEVKKEVEYDGIYADQIKILDGMGFSNTEHCLEILESTYGDLSQAIEKLLLWH